MASTRTSRSFKDISLSFDPHPVTKDLTSLVNENAIKRSVRNLVETIPTERFFNSLIGSDVRRSLFEFVDFGTAAFIKDQIEITIRNFESRVTNIQVQVNPLAESNSFDITIIYDIIGQEFPQQEFSFILEATR